jgi:exocyst complex component 2
MRDYKKGKFLLDSRPGQLLPIGTKDGQASAVEEQQQKRILDRVWVSVEKAMGEMRNMLNSRLQDPSRSIEDQEKTIEYVQSAFAIQPEFEPVYRILLELSTSDEPVWAYFDGQHKYIMRQMRETYNSAISKIRCTFCFGSSLPQDKLTRRKAILDRPDTETPDADALNMKLATQLRSSIAADDAKQVDSNTGMSWNIYQRYPESQNI